MNTHIFLISRFPPHFRFVFLIVTAADGKIRLPQCHKHLYYFTVTVSNSGLMFSKFSHRNTEYSPFAERSFVNVIA